VEPSRCPGLAAGVRALLAGNPEGPN